jgi:hypothetical protein
MKSKGVVAASIRSSRGPAGGDSCELLVANTSTCRQLRRGDLGLRHSFSGLDLSITPVKPILEVPHLMHA